MSDLAMPSEAITDLVQRVERLEASLGDGGSTDERLEARLDNVEVVLLGVRKAVDQLSSAGGDARQQRDHRRPLHTLGGSQAAQRWRELREWVNWLVTRNGIGPKEIPDCWYRHDGLVDELESLYWAWLETIKPAARANDPLMWGEQLHRARARWPLFNINGCATAHTEPRRRGMGEVADWTEFLGQRPGHRQANASRAS
jgi:hypothetical protein